MKNKLTYILAPTVIFCWCFFSLQSCKEPIIEDADLLTEDDNLSLAKDTLHIKVLSEFVDPIYSDAVSSGLLGTITDPNFGTTYAGFYAQCRTATNNISFGAGAGLDSVVLTLGYNGVYGKFDQPVTVSVYELAQSLDGSVSYRNNEALAVNLPAIGQVTGFVPNIKDSVNLLIGKLPPHVRVALSNTFGNKFLIPDTIKDNTAFLELFKGFYITTSSSLTGNGLMNIDLASSLSEITVYYHNDDADSLERSFPVSGVRFNHIDNNYTGTPVYNAVNSTNPNGEEKMYLQGGAGVRGKLIITDLDSLPRNIAINKAEIILTQTAGDTTYPASGELYLFRIDDADQLKAIDDVAPLQLLVSAQADAVGSDTLTRYHFNIKKYFQKLVQGEYNNNGFYVQTYQPYSQSDRVVIGNSTADKNYQVSLIVTYTKL